MLTQPNNIFEKYPQSIPKEYKEKVERQSEFFKIRLWEQKELVEEFLNNYNKLDEETKSEIPLKQIWVLSDDD